MTEPCFPNEKAVALEIQHGYPYKLSRFTTDYVSTGWSRLLLNKCQMPECELVVIRGALFSYYQPTEGWLSQRDALSTSSKVDKPSLVETVIRCTYLDKSSLCILGVVLCLYNDLEKKPYSLHVALLSKSIPGSGGPTQPDSALWGFRAAIMLPVKKSCCTCTEHWAAAAQNSVFFQRHCHSVRSMVLDCIGRHCLVFAYLQLWTKNMSRQSEASCIS